MWWTPFRPVTPLCEPNETSRSILLGPGMQLRTRIVGALSSGGHDGIILGLPGRPQGGGRS